MNRAGPLLPMNAGERRIENRVIKMKTGNMKHKDFKPCHLCGKGVMHAGHPLFLRISIDRLGGKGQALRRRQDPVGRTMYAAITRL